MKALACFFLALLCTLGTGLRAGEPLFRRGDSNSDGSSDLSDLVFTLSWLFRGGFRPSCVDGADTNDDGRVDISDVSWTLSWLFRGGPVPPAPFPGCGTDPSFDSLTCLTASVACNGTGIVIDLSTNRVSGVAPLFVHFDATGTAAVSTPRPFHDLLYRWNFGDAESGVWSTTGLSKNTAAGALTGHVFERAGSYTVTLLVQDRTVSALQTVQIQVIGQQEFFSPAQNRETIVVSQSGDWFGAPAGARRIQTSSWSDGVNEIRTGRRILLRSGETWEASSTTFLSDRDVQIGRFGPGPKPVINSTGDAFVFITGDRNTFMDLHVNANFKRGFSMSREPTSVADNNLF